MYTYAAVDATWPMKLWPEAAPCWGFCCCCCWAADAGAYVAFGRCCCWGARGAGAGAVGRVGAAMGRDGRELPPRLRGIVASVGEGRGVGRGGEVVGFSAGLRAFCQRSRRKWLRGGVRWS